MILQTTRLVLREFNLNDFEAFAHIVADPEVMRFSLFGPMNKEKALQYFQQRILGHYHNHGFGLWAIIFENQAIGFAGLISQEIDREKKIELGYRLLPQYWGKGLATEACQGILKYAFENCKFKEIISIVEPTNVRSLRVAERVGMTLWKNTTYHGTAVGIYRIGPLLPS
ncbi:MAG: GNAT family N-acetyltransferase [Verrucomicrobia bacterium]|nr:GNAT family N-acetyltransferase [Verrucomicrobiota bacterium]